MITVHSSGQYITDCVCVTFNVQLGRDDEHATIRQPSQANKNQTCCQNGNHP